MESCFGFVAVFLILDVSLVSTTGNTNLEINVNNEKEFFSPQTHKSQPVTQKYIAQAPNKPRSFYFPVTYTPDFVFPTEDYTEVDSSISGKLQNPPPNNCSLSEIKVERKINVNNERRLFSPQTHKSLPVTQKNIAQAPNKPRSFYLPVTYTPDFVFPTEDYPEVASSTSSKLQNPPLNNCSLSKIKAERKCDEYAREIQTKTGINCTKKYNNLSECFLDDDKYNIAGGNDIEYAVTFGEEAKLHEFPHMVALGKYSSEKTFTLICGGTLISHTWILTAAHCTYGPNGSPSHARIGFHKLSNQNAGVTIRIKRMIRHPDYKPPQMYEDIALIELVNAITFSASIRPACLHIYYKTLSPVWVSGWGTTEFAGENSDPLLKAKLDLIQRWKCKESFEDVRELPHGITPNMYCIGDPYGDWKRDTCQGDSGGPAQRLDYLYPCLHRVIGITSLGMGCAINSTPGVYTKVSAYVPWIANIVWP